ncbi:unnamed protein product, partial [Closterium sp. NIES-65]
MGRAALLGAPRGAERSRGGRLGPDALSDCGIASTSAARAGRVEDFGARGGDELGGREEGKGGRRREDGGEGEVREEAGGGGLREDGGGGGGGGGGGEAGGRQGGTDSEAVLWH